MSAVLYKLDDYRPRRSTLIVSGVRLWFAWLAFLISLSAWPAVRGDCMDQAWLAYYAADARDKGLSMEVYEERLRQGVKLRPEIYETELDAMLIIVRRAYASKANPEQMLTDTMRACMARIDI